MTRHGLFGVMFAATLTASAGRAEENRWGVATDDTRAVIGVVENRPVLLRLESAAAGGNWAGEGMAQPLMGKVWVEGREVAAKWAFEGGGLEKDTGKLTLRFVNAEPKLILRSIWQARPGAGPIEHWVEIENRTGQPVTVSHQDSLRLGGLTPGGAAAVWWIKRGGSNASTQGGTFTEPLTAKTRLKLVSNPEDGASPVPWMAVQVGAEGGLYVGWEFSGIGRIEANGGPDGKTLDVSIGNMPDFRTDVYAGQTFLVPPGFVGCYTGDIDEGSYRLHRFVQEKLRPELHADIPDPILAYNLYLDAGGPNAKEADVLRCAAFCRDLGFEAFMPDAMWFPETGDWRWDPRRFPNGINPIEKYVHGQGMWLALWCAWTNGGLATGPHTLCVRGAQADWFNADYPPDWKPGAFSGGQVCLACPPAKEWAVTKTQWLVSRHRLDYLKHDIGPIVANCNKTSHRHGYGVDVSYWATAGYYDVQEKLRAAFPRVILENCSGGGHIKDFGVIKRTHYTVTTDTLSNLPDRQSLYDSTFAIPPVILQAYTYDNVYPVKGDNPGPFLWRSAMMGAWQIDPTTTGKWTDEEKDSARRAAEIYKQWVRPMLRDVKVHHILPRPDGVHWDGMFYWSPPLKQGTLYIFRPNAPEKEMVIRLKGLEPASNYWLWCEDGSIDPHRASGGDLMKSGLTIRLPQPYSSDLIYVQTDAGGKPKGLEEPGAFQLGAVLADSDPFQASVRLSWTASPNARSYRVVVSSTADFSGVVAERVVSGQTASLSPLPPEQTFYWKVEAIGWGGRRRSDSDRGTFATPKRKELHGVTFASDLPWVSATAGAGNPVRRDVSYYGKPISIAGRAYPKGLWTHAFEDNSPADVVFDLAGKGFTTFAADAGLEDSANGGSVQFLVLLDDRVAADSGVVRPGKAHRFSVNLGGAKRLTLRVLNGGDGYVCDHSAWGLARFLAAGVSDPFAGEK